MSSKALQFLAVATIGGAAAAALAYASRRGSGRLGDFEGPKERLARMPKGWWNKKAPKKERDCYRRKRDALNKFREYNQRVIDDYGGESYEQSPAEFDAINRKYGLEGKRKVQSIAEALWVALPAERPKPFGRPFCISSIDLEALNDTSPGKYHPVGFRMPSYIFEEGVEAEEAAYYREQERRELEPSYVPF